MSVVTKPPSSEREAFSRRLDAALVHAGKSREQLAAELGVSYGTIGNWLRAKVDCPVGWIPRMATSLGVPAHELVEDPRPAADDVFAKRVVEVLERPLTAPDLMSLLADAKARLA
jgi:transcriptional regulator with XRE-family HTH domain